MAGIVMDTATFAAPERDAAHAARRRGARRGRRPAGRDLAPALPLQADAQLRLFGRVLDRLEIDRRRARDLVDRCSTPTSSPPGARPAASEGIIDLLAQSTTAEVAILFKEAGAAHADQRPHEAGRRRRDGADRAVRRRRPRPRRRRDRRPAARRGPPARPGRGGAPRRARRPLTRPVRAVAARPDAPGIDGVLVVAKPAGPTSHDIVALVRRLTGERRVGHGGTLDPFASGVLPIFLGKATRLVEYHLGATQALPRDGLLRRVLDDRRPRGRADARRRVRAPTGRRSRRRSRGFRGAIQQRPPAFSAIKVGGRRAYAMARAGETPELAPRDGDDPRPRPRSPGTASDPTRPIATIDVDLLRRARTSAPSHAISGERLGGARVPRRPRPGPRAARSRLADAIRSGRDPGVGRGTAQTALRGAAAAARFGVSRRIAGGPPRRGGTRGRRPGPVRPPGSRAAARRRPGRAASRSSTRRHPGGARPDRGSRGSRPTRSSSTSGPRGRRRPPATVAGPDARPPRPGPRARRLRSRRRRHSPDRRPRRARPPAMVRCSSSSACSTASTAATPTCSTSCEPRPSGAGAKPAVITFDAHPDEILVGSRAAAPVRPGRAAGAAGECRRRGDGRPALRSRPSDDADTTSSSR